MSNQPPKIHDNSLDYLFPPCTIDHEGDEMTIRDAYLPDEIDNYIEIEHIIRLLRSTEVAGDFIKLHCSGYGGCTLIGTRLINAINSSPANVMTIVDANCYSMHTILALSQAKTLQIEPGVQFMFHESQITLSSGVENVKNDLAAILRDDKALDKHVKKYLTKDEYKDMVNGKNIYVTGTEMKKRIDRIHKKGKKG